MSLKPTNNVSVVVCCTPVVNVADKQQHLASLVIIKSRVKPLDCRRQTPGGDRRWVVGQEVITAESPHTTVCGERREGRLVTVGWMQRQRRRCTFEEEDSI